MIIHSFIRNRLSLRSGFKRGGVGRGYTLGGMATSSSGTRTSTVYRFDLVTESLISGGLNLPSARTWHAGVASSTAGYVGGGNISSGRTGSIDKLIGSTELFVSLPATITPREHLMAFSSPTAGYFLGGMGAEAGDTSEVQKLLFATETASTTTAMSVAREDGATVVSSTAGYVGKGTGVDLFLFSNDTRSTIMVTTIPEGPTGLSGPTAGYFASGDNLTLITRLVFSTNASSSLTPRLTVARVYPDSVSSATAGYVVGGRTSTSNSTRTTERLAFETETVSTVAAMATPIGYSHGAGFVIQSGATGWQKI